MDTENCEQESNMKRMLHGINIKVQMTKIVFLDQWHNIFQPLEVHQNNKKFCHLCLRLWKKTMIIQLSFDNFG